MSKKRVPPRRKRIEQADIVKGFADRLRKIRLSRGMSQSVLASSAHIHWTYVGRLERGETAPGLDLIGRLAGALNTPVIGLLPSAPVEERPFLQKQARARLESILEHADNPALGILNAMLTMMDDSQRRRH